MRKSHIIIILIILASFIIGIYFYPKFPERIASHWNADGQVDGYMSKCWVLFLMPIISVVLFLLFVLIPKIDPLKANIEKFRNYFDSFVVLIILFLFYLYLLTVIWNLGKRFNMVHLLVPAFAILFYCAGILIKEAKRNWFIGIRTPWTLSSEKVWEKTHKIGAVLFKGAGIIALFGLIFQKIAIWLVIVPIIFIAIYAVFYSYFEYRKENR